MNTPSTLTKRQKQIQAHRAIKKFIVDKLTPMMLNELKEAVNDVEIDKTWLEEDNKELQKHIIKKFILFTPVEIKKLVT